MVGVAGCTPMRGVLGGGSGDEKGLEELKEVLEVSSTPRASTSRLSLRTTVPSARRACSKSKSVLDTRRLASPWTSFGPTGWRPAGKDVGSGGDRGDGCRNNEARL